MEHLVALWILSNVRFLVRTVLIPRNARKHESTCWFAEHALVNALLTVLAWPGLLATMRAPEQSMDATLHANTWAASSMPMCVTVWLHAYHAICYDLSWEDRFHHGVFIATLAVPGWRYRWGALGNAQLFWICGLPGGLLYGLLAAQRCNRLAFLSEPKVSAWINVVLRCPGILLCSWSMVYSLVNGALPEAPVWAITLQLILGPINAVYYAVQSVQRARRGA